MFNYPLIRYTGLCLVSALLGFAFLPQTSGVAWAASAPVLPGTASTIKAISLVRPAYPTGVSTVS